MASYYASTQEQQKPPRRIKFLLERLDHSWDVYAIEKAFTRVCATQERSAGDKMMPYSLYGVYPDGSFQVEHLDLRPDGGSGR